MILNNLLNFKSFGKSEIYLKNHILIYKISNTTKTYVEI